MSKRKLETVQEFVESSKPIKVQKKNAKKANKEAKKKNLAQKLKDDLGEVSLTRDEKKKWRNKQRVLLLSSRGTIARYRHLMKDFSRLLPHHKKDAKVELKEGFDEVNEMCELKNCSNCIFFEVRKRKDCYLWISKAPNGPSAKFHVTNVHTLNELKLIGNCLMGSRPLLIFDKNFEPEDPSDTSKAHWQLLREMFIHVFGTPKGHPNMKPFIDHAISFFVQDGRIWFRHYQIVEKDKKDDIELVEIGPRFVLNPIRIFAGSFGGPTLYQNHQYISPNVVRASLRQRKSMRFINRVMEQKKRKTRKDQLKGVELDELDDVFE